MPFDAYDNSMPEDIQDVLSEHASQSAPWATEARPAAMDVDTPVVDAVKATDNLYTDGHRQREDVDVVRITGKRARGRPRKQDKQARRAVHIADDSLHGEADMTMVEQSLAVPRPVVPWTVSKAPMTPAELQAMRAELHNVVQLALGERASRSKVERSSDADVLCHAVRRELRKAQ